MKEPGAPAATRGEEEVEGREMSEVSERSDSSSHQPPEAPRPEAALLQGKISAAQDDDSDDTSSSMDDADIAMITSIAERPRRSSFSDMITSIAERPRRASFSDSRELSRTSRKYDVGQKGYLTAAEQHMRDIDRSQRGYLTNEQVANVVEQTMEIREHNVRLRNLVLGLFAAVLVLGVTNLALAFAAARLAKDTEVNGESGVLYVKGSTSTVIVTQSLGSTYTAVVHQNDGDNGSFVCLSVADLTNAYAQSMKEGIDTSMVLETSAGTADEKVETLSLSRTGSYFNDTHVVVRDLYSGRAIAFDLTSNLCNERMRRRQLLQNEGEEEELSQPQPHVSFQMHLEHRARRRELCPIAGLCPPAEGGDSGEEGGGGFVPGYGDGT